MIMRALSLFIAICFAGLTACGQTLLNKSSGESDAPYGARVQARLIDTTGQRIGKVIAWQSIDGMLLQVRAENLPAGMHGLHLHAVGNCSDIGSFKLSGGHLQGEGGVHGLLHPNGSHGGDLPNLYAHENGIARADFFSTLVTIGDLQDTDGAALIVHKRADDYQTHPIGGAGARIACAVFKGGR